MRRVPPAGGQQLPIRSWMALLIALYVLAVVLRVIGVDWHGTHPDEAPGTSVRMLTGQLTGFQLFYPPLLNYLVALAYALMYPVGRVLGWWHSAADLRALYFSDKTYFYVTARVVVALASAAVAPLAALLARQLRIEWRWAIATGLIAAMMPGEIFWSHIEKSDPALAAAFLFVTLAAYRLVEMPERKRRAAALGLSIALALSVKQSALFYLVPLLVATLLLSLWETERRGTMLGGWVVAAVATLVIWPILNIGILLDLKGFLAAQHTQSVMSFRAASANETFAAWWEAMTAGDSGLPGLLLLAAVALVVGAIGITRDRGVQFRLGISFVAGLVAIVVIVAIAGSRQPHQLMLPYVSLLAIQAMLAAGLIARRNGAGLAVALAFTAVLAMCEIARVREIYRQLHGTPTSERVAESVMTHVPRGAAIMVAIGLPPSVPQTDRGPAEERARNVRLAARYDVSLPTTLSPLPRSIPGGYSVRAFPFAMGGMERAPENSRVLVPFTWPLQQAEWKLDYWTTQGYRYFLIDPANLTPDNPPAYRNFFGSIVRGCRQLDAIHTDRRMLMEQDLALYDCGAQLEIRRR